VIPEDPGCVRTLRVLTIETTRCTEVFSVQILQELVMERAGVEFVMSNFMPRLTLPLPLPPPQLIES
jgi:hypothetical protein